MQLLNESVFRVTAEADQKASGTGREYCELAYRPLKGFCPTDTRCRRYE